MNTDTGNSDTPAPAAKKSPLVWMAVGAFLAFAFMAIVALIFLIVWFWPPKLPVVRSGTIQLWLRADAGMVTNVEGQVSRWKDQSGHANDASQSNPDNEPFLVSPPGLGGKPAVRFNGNQDGLNGDFLQGAKQVDVPDAMTSFIVYNAHSATNRENDLWLIGVPGTTYGACRGDMIAGGNAHFTLWAYDYNTPFFVPPNTCRIRIDCLNKKMDKLNVFDVSAGSSNSHTFAIEKTLKPEPGYYVGGLDIHDPARPYVATSRCFDGDIMELIVYQGCLTEADRLSVQGYLQKKYSLAGK